MIHSRYNLDTMNTTTLHIKTDIQIRDSAKKIAEEFDLSLTALVNIMLKQIVRTKHLNLSLDEEPTPYMIETLKKSEEDVKAARVISFETKKDILDYLEKEIENEKLSTH